MSDVMCTDLLHFSLGRPTFVYLCCLELVSKWVHKIKRERGGETQRGNDDDRLDMAEEKLSMTASYKCMEIFTFSYHVHKREGKEAMKCVRK
jgi:hypothetical protein